METTEELYTLVDISTLEGTSFLKRAPLNQILLWGKLFGSEGRITKRLDLILACAADGISGVKEPAVEQLQYLYYSSTQLAPPDGEELIAKCAELSTLLDVDETSVEELTSRIPPELLQGASHSNKGAMNYMGQGGAEKDLTKGTGKAPAQTDEEKAAVKAAKDAEKAALKAGKAAEKAEAKAKREQEKAEAKAAREAAKANKPPKENLSVDKVVIESAFGAVTDQDAAIAKAQEAYLALAVAKDGGRSADSRTYSVEIPLKHSAETGVVPTQVSVMWFAATASGLKTAQFYRRDAINLIRKLGLVPLQEGVPIPVKEPKPAPAEKVAEQAAA